MKEEPCGHKSGCVFGKSLWLVVEPLQRHGAKAPMAVEALCKDSFWQCVCEWSGQSCQCLRQVGRLSGKTPKCLHRLSVGVGVAGDFNFLFAYLIFWCSLQKKEHGFFLFLKEKCHQYFYLSPSFLLMVVSLTDLAPLGQCLKAGLTQICSHTRLDSCLTIKRVKSMKRNFLTRHNFHISPTNVKSPPVV